MKYHDEWKPVLEQELNRWSIKSAAELAARLKEERTYEVNSRSKLYQVEVVLLENTEAYVHVGIAVDDGH